MNASSDEPQLGVQLGAQPRGPSHEASVSPPAGGGVETQSLNLHLERYRNAQALFEQLIEYSEEERKARLDAACAHDPELRMVVEGLLHVDQQYGGSDPSAPLGSHRARRLAPAAMAGARFGRYVVCNQIGIGGMGIVYMAYDPDLDRRVALKLLRTNREHAQARARLQREAMAMARVTHPNVVAIYDVGTLDERVFIAMEYIEGMTLRTWMNEPRDWREIVAMFVSAGHGLRAAHDAGLIHRDFKPDNVMVTHEGQAKVTDFGLVRTSIVTSSSIESSIPVGVGVGVDDGENSDDDLGRPLTEAGTLMGTPTYMSPEQLACGVIDARTDVFSFCVTLYEALWNRMPFGEGSVAMLRGAILDGPAIPSSGTVPAWLAQLVARGLAHDPEQRWPTMSALLAALQDDPRQRRYRRLGLGALALIPCLMGGGVWLDAERTRAQCEREADAIAVHWSGAIAESQRASMHAIDAEFATETADRAIDALDSWADQWRDSRFAACEAARKGKPLEETRVQCLEDLRDEFGGLLEALADGDRFTLVYALETIHGQPSPETCSDPVRLVTRQGHEDADGPAVSALRHQLARARALTHATRFDEALAITTRLLENPILEQAPSLRAKAGFTLAEIHEGLYHDDRAQELLEDTYHGASRAGFDELAVKASLHLARIAGTHSDFPRARLWLRQAETLAVRQGNRPAELGPIQYYRAAVFLHSGSPSKAEAEFRTAISLLEGLHGASNPLHIQALTSLARILAQRGETDEAMQMLEHARSLAIAGLGAGHVDVARITSVMAGFVTPRDPQQARALYEESLAIIERALGPDHPKIAVVLHSLANLETYLERYEEAVQLFERAISIEQRAQRPRSAFLAVLAMHRAIIYIEIDRRDEARRDYEYASSLLNGDEATDRAKTDADYRNLGILALEFEEMGQAAEHFERAYELSLAKNGPEHLWTGFNLGYLGMLACTRGETSVGIEQLGDAIAVLEHNAECPPETLQELSTSLAECKR